MFNQFMQQPYMQQQPFQQFAGMNPIQAFLASLMVNRNTQPFSGRMNQPMFGMGDLYGRGSEGMAGFGGMGSNLDQSNSVAGMGMSPMGRAALGFAFGPLGTIAGSLAGMARGYNGYGELGNGGLGTPGDVSGPGTIGSRDAYGSNQSRDSMGFGFGGGRDGADPGGGRGIGGGAKGGTGADE